MPDTHEPGGEGEFVILPDRDGVLSPTVPGTGVLATHPSGRPLIAGALHGDRLLVSRTPAGTVAVLGFCPVDRRLLESRLAGSRTPADMQRAASGLPGSHHVVVSSGGTVRAWGTLAHTRRLFYDTGARAANRADLLAAGATALDETALALRLLLPGVPHPLSETTVWQGVRSLPGDHFLELTPDGRARTGRRWSPPDPELTRSQAAVLLREALSTAVHARVEAGGAVVSCDLSGGLDSTPVAYLAWQRAPRLVALTLTGLTSEDDDTAAAVRAAGHMPGADHRLIGVDGLPHALEGLFDTRPRHDEPFQGLQSARFLELARLARSAGSRLHLTGHGGDEVLTAPPSYVHTLIRQHPLSALNHLYGQRGLRRWSVRQTWQLVGDRRSYGAWLAHSARHLRSPMPGQWRVPPPLWHQALRLPPWITARAAQAVADALADAARQARPLAETRTQHLALENIRTSGRIARLVDQLTAEAGVHTATPYLDDRVVEICLATRPEERSSPWEFKPLLREALARTVPHGMLQRSTKNDMAEDVHAGLRGQRRRLAALCEDSRLARMGLIDAGELRQACLAPQRPGPLPAALILTLNCESWLRGRVSPTPRSIVGGTVTGGPGP
ncbi:asparagine synthase-related protein [Streptomyces lavenduligriseus]|uniref:asparagine synthase (glutamine-hydrolyzing) n=1 Tax=Streptomyces lavenduligriseus TaxID=67315 RepID=A0ABT0NV64_9ACTN|nr:asparagine synthase-related protein [Streptomyces lavenduligriseus]MCL3994648.1 asparagine synthase-related protein [Streptomyces lavenduligriseus]